MAAPFRIHAVPGDGEAPENAFNVELWGAGSGGGEATYETVTGSVPGTPLTQNDLQAHLAQIFGYLADHEDRITALENP